MVTPAVNQNRGCQLWPKLILNPSITNIGLQHAPSNYCLLTPIWHDLLTQCNFSDRWNDFFAQLGRPSRAFCLTAVTVHNMHSNLTLLFSKSLETFFCRNAWKIKPRFLLKIKVTATSLKNINATYHSLFSNSFDPVFNPAPDSNMYELICYLQSGIILQNTSISHSFLNIGL